MNAQLVAIHTLKQLSNLLTQLDEALYKKSLDIFSSSSFGNHIRHILEFFQCLLNQYPEGKVNYDLRQRNSLLETAPCHAISIIEELCHQLSIIETKTSLTLETCYQTKGDQFIEAGTSIERELIYNIEHAIHHMAIIKIGIKVYAPDIELPEDFGVAPSTIKYQRATQSQKHMEITGS